MQQSNLTWVGYPNVEIRYEYIDTNEENKGLTVDQRLRFNCMEMATNYCMANPELAVDVYKEAKKMYLFVLDNKTPR